MDKSIKEPIIASIIVTIFALVFHYQTVVVHDWISVLIWLPVYLSPIWVITGIAAIVNKRKEKKEQLATLK